MNATEIAIKALAPEHKVLREKALTEGYTDEECPKCQAVVLAHHHFIRCGDVKCPMSTKKPDGSPKRVFDYMRERADSES